MHFVYSLIPHRANFLRCIDFVFFTAAPYTVKIKLAKYFALHDVAVKHPWSATFISAAQPNHENVRLENLVSYDIHLIPIRYTG